MRKIVELRVKPFHFFNRMIRGLGAVSVVQIACGDNHSMALTRGGKLFSWGDNQHGQLGHGNLDKIVQPQPIECLNSLPIRHIACGGQHSFLVSNSGAVYAWGKNNKGQLGLGDTDDRMFPTQVRSLRNQKICYIACGQEHTICLTEDGGVFSFGSGQYGQLGHGSKNDEQLPRKIIELMGTEVSQIACGRKHTLALVPTRGRVYAFGLGGSGQLGQSTYNSTITPQVVHGSWVGPSGEPSAPKRILKSNEEKVIVTRIGAGGDQSFAIVQDPKVKPLDLREETNGIEKLTKELIQEMNSKSENDVLEQDFMEKLEVIFQHPACINASLLLNTHKPCTSKNNGVDMPTWTKTTFNFYFKLTNETIKDVITTGLTKYVLPKLESNPPDVETLRQFLVLPLFMEFENESLYKEVHCAYARGFISLPKAAMNVVEKWFIAQTKEYFLPMIGKISSF